MYRIELIFDDHDDDYDAATSIFSQCFDLPGCVEGISIMSLLANNTLEMISTILKRKAKEGQK